MALASRDELEAVQDFVRPEPTCSDCCGVILRNTNRIEAVAGAIREPDGVLRQTPAGSPLRRSPSSSPRSTSTSSAATSSSSEQPYSGVVDRIVTGFSEEDVEALGDNVVLILQTVKEMTQPEIMAILYRMIEAIQRQQAVIEAEPEERAEPVRPGQADARSRRSAAAWAER